MKTFPPNPSQKIIIPKPHRARKFIITFILIGLTIGGVWWWISKDSGSRSQQEQPEQLFPAINGVMVDKTKAETRPVGVVIENAPEARPQSGLTDADLVYETVAEGGITRFLAVFQTREPKEIGPVRSARPYFNFLTNMWRGAIIHSGGSKAALSELSAGVHKNLYDVNEFYFGKYFSRDSARYAPHNLYTTREKLRDVLSDKKESGWQPIAVWQFETVPTDQLAPEVTNITIPFSFPLFEAKYQFDPSTNSYQRLLNGKPHLDRNNDLQISPTNILIHLTDISLNANDELGTMTVRLDDNGPCYLFTAGKFKECRWRYENGKHIYTDTEGNPLKLQPGQTWIEIFPRDKQSELTWN